MSGHRKSYLKGVLYGSLIGAGLALIYSPRKGEQSQALLRETAEETRQRAEDFSRTVTEETHEWGKLGGELYSEGKVLLDKTVDRIKDRIRSYQQDIN
jgi:gas vesicle protein